jgi:hypothetical protein
MGAVEFDPDEIAVKVLGCNERRAGAAERVKYDPASLAERPDEGLQRFDWLLRGMKAIAGVCEVDDRFAPDGRRIDGESTSSISAQR